MASWHERAENALDTANIKKHLDDYSRSTGVNAILIDMSGDTVFSTGKGDAVCGMCQKAQHLLSDFQKCQNVHLYGSYQAERFGGSYIFFCPLGLVHWASPILAGGAMKGAVLGGPVLMMEPSEFLLEELLGDLKINPKSIKDLKEHAKDVPVIKPDAVTSMAALLFIVAEHCSGIQPSRLTDDRESLEQQSHISEYIHHIKTMGGDDADLPSYPIEKEKELMSLIALGDNAGSQRVLNEIFGHVFFSTGRNFEVVKARVLELVVLLSRAAMEGGADIEQIFGLNYSYLSQIHDFSSVDELTSWLSKIMARFTDCVFNLTEVKHIDVIYKAVNYIKLNYMKKITLEEAASHVYLSPSYFCKVFKDELKCNFTVYLNKIRIEAAKKYLLNDSVSLVEISNLVGYEDQSYFTKVFKKTTGVSPGRFRESRGIFSKGRK